MKSNLDILEEKNLHLEALNFDFHEFLHFLKVEIHQIIISGPPRITKTAILEAVEVQNMPFLAILRVVIVPF